MYKDNEIMKLAYASITKNKRSYRFVSGIITFAFFICVAFTISLFSYEKMQEQDRDNTYGSWVQYDENLSKEALDKYQKSLFLDGLGILEDVGHVEMNEANYGMIGNYNEDMKKIANLTFLAGRYPSRDTEIVVEQPVLKQLGYEENTLEQVITLSYQQNQQVLTKDFIVVGIIEEYSATWSVPMPSFISIDLPYSKQRAFLQAKQHLTFLNKNMFTDLQINEERFPSLTLWSTFNVYGDQVERYQENVPDTTMLLNQILFVMMMSILGVMIAMNRKRREEIIMLRRIGATNFQIFKLLVYELGMITFKQAIFGCVIGGLVAACTMAFMANFYHMEYIFVVNIVELVSYLFACVVVIFVAMALSFVDIIIIAINGSVDKPKRTNMKKYACSKYLHMFRLAWKNILFHRGIYILLVIIFLVVELRGLQNIDEIKTYQQKVQELQSQDTYDYCMVVAGLLQEVELNQKELTNAKIDVVVEKSSHFNYEVEWPGMLLRSFDESTKVPESLFSSIEPSKGNYQSLVQHLISGRMPEADYEVLAYLPDGYKDESGEVHFGFFDVDDNMENDIKYVKETSLKPGMEVKVSKIEEEEKQEVAKLKVVGILSNDLALPYDFQQWGNYRYGGNRMFYVTNNTYHLLGIEGYQKVYLDGITKENRMVAKQAINRWKYLLGDKMEIIYANHQEIKNQIQELQLNIIKNMGVSICMIVGLVIIFRVVSKTVLENEKKYIRMYQSLGMIDAQVYTMLFYESIFIVLPTVGFYLLQMLLFPSLLSKVTYSKIFCFLGIATGMCILFISSYLKKGVNKVDKK